MNIRKVKDRIISFAKRHIKILLAVFAVLLIISQTPFGQGIFRQTQPLKTQKVERKNLIRSFTASGTITPTKKSSLHFQTPGKVAWVGIKKGDNVFLGQALASQDTTELQAAHRQAEQDFIAAKAEVEKVYDETGRKVDESFSEKIKRTAAEAKQNKAFDQMKIVEKKMQDSVLVSPIGGVVIAVGFEQGENVSVTNAIEIIDPASIRFIANIDETDFATVAPGQKVKITLDAFSGREFKGEVVFIADATEQTSSGASSIAVEIEIQTDHSTLISGLSGEAQFIQDEKLGVIIPKMALTAEGENTFVYVLKKGAKEKRNVKVGLQTEKDVQILSGLSQGETIIIQENKNERR